MKTIIDITAEGINEVMNVYPEDEQGFFYVEVNGKEFNLYNFEVSEKRVSFEIGKTDEDYEEYNEFKHELAKALPNKILTLLKFCYEPGMSGSVYGGDSYCFSMLNGKYTEWLDY